jgi:hypothetical protein
MRKQELQREVDTVDTVQWVKSDLRPNHPRKVEKAAKIG